MLVQSPGHALTPLVHITFTGFTEDYVAGCAPLVVHFTNTSTGATSYSWDLGNGTPLTGLTNPSTSYTAAGTYTVTLTAYNGSSSSVTMVTITVYPTPTVSFTASDTSVCPGTPITFTSTSSSGVAGPLTYMWNFGDGTSSTSASPTHTFPGPGYYNITLSVTNAQGCISSLTEAGYIAMFLLLLFPALLPAPLMFVILRVLLFLQIPVPEPGHSLARGHSAMALQAQALRRLILIPHPEHTQLNLLKQMVTDAPTASRYRPI